MLKSINAIKIRQQIKEVYLYFMLFQLISIHKGVSKKVKTKNIKEMLSIPIIK